MNIIICEGRNDVWFFEEMFNKHPIIHKRIYPMIDKPFYEFERNVLKVNCFRFMKENYDLLIFGDTGKPTIHEKLFPDIINDLVGNHREEICILLVLDDDGIEYKNMYNKVSRILCSLSKNKMKFQKTPNFYEKDGFFIFEKVGKVGHIKAKLITVPQNIETVVVRTCIKYKEIDNSKKYDLSENSPHEVMNELAKNYFEKNIEDLIRYSASNLINHDLESEQWAKDIMSYS